jgi:hypothetical protein
MYNECGFLSVHEGKMKNCMFRPLQGAVLLLACLVSGAWADDTLVLTGAGATAVMGGVYTSPYQISVNGTPTLLICDDFTTDVAGNQPWQAGVTSLSQVNTAAVSTLKFGSDSNAALGYATAAVLSAELFALPNVGTASEDTETAGELSYAIWSIFDSALLNSLNANGSTGYGTLTGAEVAAVNSDIANANALVAHATQAGTTNLNEISINGQSISSLIVYTPAPVTASQEFLQISMAEPSYPAVLALDLLAVAGLIVAFRRRISGLLN